MSYCSYIKTLSGLRRVLHQNYHDRCYGFPLHDDHELFGRLLLEINQAGLSWETILKKESNFRRAYDSFDISKVAAYGQADRHRLLADAGIIRHRLKIEAAIQNAQVILQLQQEWGSFAQWLQEHHACTQEEWIFLFKKKFFFTGSSTVLEFLMSIGLLPGAHQDDCPIKEKIEKIKSQQQSTI